MELLARFLNAATPGDADRFLEELLEKVARPLAGRIVRSRLGFSGAARADIDDACAETLFETLSRLRQAQAGRLRIANFEAYVAGLASRVSAEIFSNRFPARKRLRYRLRYILTSDPRFQLWQSPRGSSLCGLAGAAGEPASPSALERCRDELPAASPDKLPEVVFAVFRRLDAPVDLNDLTSLAARLTGVAESYAAVELDPDTLAAKQPNPADRAESIDWLRAVWQEIAGLPQAQRVALILGMRSAEGAAAWLIADLGIASFREFAACLGMDARDLAAIWNRLPLNDKEIALRLALDRQQVINLRSAARRRLARRMNLP
jgi:hypothetical protein